MKSGRMRHRLASLDGIRAMIVWCTGISGSGRGDYLREVERFFRSRDLDCEVFEFGDLLARVQADDRMADDVTTLLDGNTEVLRAHRLAAFDALVSRLAQRPPESYSFVSTHACFMRRGRLQPGMDMAPLKRLLEPMVDMYVTVIDGCVPVYARQQHHDEWRGHLSLAEIAIWRDFETSLTQMLAGYEGKPFYLLARQEPAEALYRLCLRPREKTVYLAYPITAILDEHPGLIDSALAVGEDLREAGFVVFNPLSVEDIGEAAGVYDIDVPLPEDQFEAARPYIDSQIIGRDFQLIDQSDMVVVYYPTEKLSPGVLSEMMHARDRRIPVYLCGFPGAISPFLGILYQEAFETPAQLVQRLAEIRREAQ
jgi:adenylate kinase